MSLLACLSRLLPFVYVFFVVFLEGGIGVVLLPMSAATVVGMMAL